MRKHLGWTALLAVALFGLWASAEPAAQVQAGGKDKIRVLIIDGQNNHAWTVTTPQMKKSLEASGRFVVDVATSPPKPPNAPGKPKKDAKDKDKDGKKYKAAVAKYEAAVAKYNVAITKYNADMAAFQPALDKYDVVLSNYNGLSWSPTLNQKLDSLLSEGKIGLVIIHAANNAFGGWKEYNLMIGMGWRGANAGERLKLDDEGKEIRVPAGKDQGSGHRYTGPFSVIVRDSDHPITKGMPREWQHVSDELYDNMRGPIQNIRLLATAAAPAGKKGTGAHEPMIWTIAYGKGRVFHTPLGHDANAMRCVGFITTLQRGTEWAATGAVTIPIPPNFPTAEKTSIEK